MRERRPREQPGHGRMEKSKTLGVKSECMVAVRAYEVAAMLPSCRWPAAPLPPLWRKEDGLGRVERDAREEEIVRGSLRTGHSKRILQASGTLCPQKKGFWNLVVNFLNITWPT